MAGHRGEGRGNIVRGARGTVLNLFSEVRIGATDIDDLGKTGKSYTLFYGRQICAAVAGVCER